MRYFIGYHIRGEAAEYYKATCADLATRFGIDDVSAIVAPHVTVKTPFEKSGIEMVDDILALSTEVPPIPFMLSGWNHFTTRTIFIDAPEPPAEIKQYIKDIVSKLRGAGLSSSPQEADPHIHMSVARFLKPPQFEEIWKYISSIPAPTFDMNFDNLTIFSKENRDEKAWKILKTFPLTGVRK